MKYKFFIPKNLSSIKDYAVIDIETISTKDELEELLQKKLNLAYLIPFFVKKIGIAVKKENVKNLKEIEKYLKKVDENFCYFIVEDESLFKLEEKFKKVLKNLEIKNLVAFNGESFDFKVLSLFFGKKVNERKYIKIGKKIIYLKDILKAFGNKKISLEKLSRELSLEGKGGKSVDEYLLKDLELEVKIVEYFKKENLSFSLSSIAFSTLKNVIKKDKKIIFKSYEIDAPLFFQGGLSVAFQKGKFLVDILDVNSLYPYVMSEYPIFPEKIEKIDKDFLSLYIENMQEDILPISLIKVKNVKGKPFISFYTRENGKAKYVLENEKVYFVVGLEHKELLKYDVDYEVLYSYLVYLKKSTELSEFIKESYERRKVYKKEGKNALAFFLKLRLNSLFGVFGKVYLANEKKLTEKELKEFIKGAQKIDKDFYVSYYENYFIDKNFLTGKIFHTFSNPLASIFITSFARYYMFEKIEKLKSLGAKVYYTDTDSLFIDSKDRKKYEKVLKIGDALGEFKIEEKNVIVNIIDRKIYKIEGKGYICPGFKRFGSGKEVNVYLDKNLNLNIVKKKVKGFKLWRKKYYYLAR